MEINTINAQYEYRISQIVKKMVHNQPIRRQDGILMDGESLEKFLKDWESVFVEYLLDDIQEWMGFDVLLEQVKK